MEKVDLVVFWVNENDMSGRQDFNFWRTKELESGIQSAGNSQAGGAERLRDRGEFKYGFRAAEKNCPGVNKIFLVLARPAQIPDGLNTNAEKLRIVYHDEFIPTELLPTFNPFIIGTYLHRIQDLSEHFLLSDDDCFFMNKINYNHYFQNGKPVMADKHIPGYVGRSQGVWWQVLRNTFNFTTECCGYGRHFYLNHLINPHIKSYEKYFYDKYEDKIKEHNNISRFRHPKNVCMTIAYLDALRNDGKACLIPTIDDHSQYMEVHTANFNYAKQLEVVCFNDVGMSEETSQQAGERYLAFGQSFMPDKCSFEK